MFLQSIRKHIPFDAPGNLEDANIRYLYLEIFFAAILGAIATFNILFAVRLGASVVLVGILSSVPSLLVAILSIPSARYLESKRDHKTWLLHSLMLMRLGHLGLVIIPILFPFQPLYTLPAQHTLPSLLNAIHAPQSVTAIWLTAWLLALVIPNAFFSNGFNALLAEIVPERRRAFVFSRRTIIYSLMVTLVTAGAGVFLDHTTAIFPLNYQLLYLFGVLTVLGSQHYLWKLGIEQVRLVTEPDAPVKVAKPKAIKTALTVPMKKYLFNAFVYQCGIQLPGSLFVLHYANNLKASDGLISLNVAAGTLSFVFGLFVWEMLIRKRGFFWSMRLATCFTWVFPFTVAITNDFTLIILGNVLVNLIHPGMELSIVNVIFKLCSAEQRNMNMSYYTTVLSLSAFLMPLAAVPLSGSIGIPAVMLIAAGLRLAGGILFNVNKVQAAAPDVVLQTA